MQDADLLFAWRNDPQTRIASKDQSELTFASHIDWLERRLRNQTPHLYLAEDEGVPVGTFRIDGDSISYTVAPDHRGKGIATTMLLMAKDMFGAKNAEVRRENIASIKAVTNSGHLLAIID